MEINKGPSLVSLYLKPIKEQEVSIIRSKAPSHVLSTALNEVHLLKLYPFHYPELYPS
jgi:hypothetical protein